MIALIAVLVVISLTFEFMIDFQIKRHSVTYTTSRSYGTPQLNAVCYNHFDYRFDRKMEAQNAVIPQLDPLKRETTDVSAVDQPQNIEEKGTWLLITNPLGSTLGYVRLDDHDHDLDLSEIREMIHMKLATQAEYQHGWGFGTGWPLKIVSRKEEQSVLAKGVLPAITVLSDHSAQLLSQQADVISAATVCNVISFDLFSYSLTSNSAIIVISKYFDDHLVFRRCSMVSIRRPLETWTVDIVPT